jgi:hypothetical protein
LPYGDRFRFQRYEYDHQKRCATKLSIGIEFCHFLNQESIKLIPGYYQAIVIQLFYQITNILIGRKSSTPNNNFGIEVDDALEISKQTEI